MNEPAPTTIRLCCPTCRTPLHKDGKTYTCEGRHSFDLAKEGYINLLLSHQRRSKNPGDDKAMIQARRRFFDSGAFDPVTAQISKMIPKGTVLDCGCGEGHFLGELPSQGFGVDVSKEAIRSAAKRYKEATWIVANGMRELPVLSQSMDTILSVLAPRNIEEFDRILKSDGILILGVPGPNHLIELRAQFQSQARDFEEKADEAAAKCAPQFQEAARENISYSITLQQEQISDLIQMTPIFWNTSPEAKEKVLQLEELQITISFALVTLTKATR